MTRLLQVLLGRLPIGWLQLIHSRPRMIAAVAGITFANLLIYVQMGVVASIAGSINLSYSPFRGDIMISTQNSTDLTGSLLSRRVLYLALADPGVAEATPLYVNRVEWKQTGGITKTLTIYGLVPEATRFAGDAIGPQLSTLGLPGHVLIDSLVSSADAAAISQASSASPVIFEINKHQISVVGSFSLGGGFGADGALIASDQTFMILSDRRSMATPSHILIAVKSGQNPATVAKRLSGRLSTEYVRVRTVSQAITEDVAYMNTQAPMGIIFGAGQIMGLLVGLVIVYQVLANDVAAHLKEYATFKAMGYSHRFIVGIVFEEAMIVAIIGYIPGLVLGAGIYMFIASATGLPMGMTAARAAAVFFGTLAACAASGALATIRLRGADPAELFA